MNWFNSGKKLYIPGGYNRNQYSQDGGRGYQSYDRRNNNSNISGNGSNSGDDRDGGSNYSRDGGNEGGGYQRSYGRPNRDYYGRGDDNRGRGDYRDGGSDGGYRSRGGMDRRLDSDGGGSRDGADNNGGGGSGGGGYRGESRDHYRVGN